MGGSGTGNCRDCPANSHADVHDVRHDQFLKEAQKTGIRDVISKSEGEQPLLKSLKSMLSLVA